jgi:hypothetical protein
MKKKKGPIEEKLEKFPGPNEEPWVEPVRGGEKKYELKEYEIQKRTSEHDIEDINEVWKEEEVKEYEEMKKPRKKKEDEEESEEYED